MHKQKDGDPVDDDVSATFYAALGRCISLWATVEFGVESLLQACLRKAETEVVAAVSTTVDNFRAKAGMAQAALGVVLKDPPVLLAEWTGLFDRLQKKSKITNMLAHG